MVKGVRLIDVWAEEQADGGSGWLEQFGNLKIYLEDQTKGHMEVKRK
jgi:hypothetical protein